MHLTAKVKHGKPLLAKRKGLSLKRRGILAKGKKIERRGGSRERSGRFSLFRPKIRGRAYPVQDNAEGWKIFDRIRKQSKISGSDIFTLGMRNLVREFPNLTKDSAIKISKNLASHTFFPKQ